MQVLQAKKYNAEQTAKWNRDWDKAKLEGRSWNCMPQLAFYLSSKQYGYWAMSADGKSSYWGKTKKVAIERAS